MSEWNEEFWCDFVDHITAYQSGKIIFLFKNGKETELELK